MAVTSISKTDAMRKQIQEAKLYKNYMRNVFFNRFTDKSKNSIVWMKEVLGKGKGDKVTFGIRTTDVEDHAGVEGRSTLEGNEVALSTGDFYVELERYRQGCVHDGDIDEARAAYDISETERDFLQDWAADKYDGLFFDAAYSAPTNIIYNSAGTNTFGSSAATAIAAVDATNSLLTPALISYAKSQAKTGANGSIFRIKPIKINGVEWYVMVVSPGAMLNLRANTVMQSAQRDALVRGEKNPLFRGGDLMWDGVIITENERVQTGTDGGSGGAVPYAECLFLGKNAFVRADGKKMQIREKTFDYGVQLGTSMDIFTAVDKAKFDSKDYALMDVICATK